VPDSELFGKRSAHAARLRASAMPPDATTRALHDDPDPGGNHDREHHAEEDKNPELFADDHRAHEEDDEEEREARPDEHEEVRVGGARNDRGAEAQSLLTEDLRLADALADLDRADRVIEFAQRDRGGAGHLDPAGTSRVAVPVRARTSGLARS